MRALVLALVAVAGTAATAHAYPQYQLSKEQSCSACHVTPTGGGLLNDYGELVAEEESQFGGNPAFLHGAVELPEWLNVGGDIRLAGGAHDNGKGIAGAVIPMQTELYLHAERGAIGVYAIGGLTPKENSIAPFSREHFILWKQGEGEGLYARAGRFMPVMGLRLAEHPYYVRRFGGTPLHSEVYGANVGWLSPELEAHLTAFIADPLVDSIERGDGAALYVEKRFGNKSVGLIDRYTTSDTDTRLQGGLTGKVWLEGSKLLLSAEGQVIRQDFKLDRGPTRVQLVGQLLATYFARPGLWVELGVGHFDEDQAVADLERDSVDVNVHFFPISHLELVLMTRLQLIGLGGGGDKSGFSLLQLHYRI